ncbi:MAG: cytochrome c [Planctomycetota bacterium]|nr:cytochrome c [Planctomycetota bacterium]
MKILKTAIVLSGLLLMIGCAEPARFQLNVVAHREAEQDQPFARQKVEDVANVLTALFGTPDDPAFPNAKSLHWYLEYDEEYSVDLETLVRFENLQRAAGPVGTDEKGRSRGLYREHCAHCHGVTGGGAGPTAASLSPYPRDFRNGVFKFKSTTGKSRPSDEDLMRILNEGVHGTAMPSFKVAISESEKRALVDYIKYLSIRGEVELALWDFTANLDKEERLPLVFAKGYEQLNDDQKDEILGWFESDGVRIESIFKSWIKAHKKPLIKKPTSPPARFAADHADHYQMVDRGRELFHGKKLGACTQCHGDTGYGDGELGNFDIWNKWAKGKTAEKVAAYTSQGVLPPRNIRPRNFRNGVFRGGRSPTQLFYRIKNGIQGSEMPGAATLTDEEVWCLVAYVRSIKTESITGGQQSKPVINKPIH